jgi:hypothetical protein
MTLCGDPLVPFREFRVPAGMMRQTPPGFARGGTIVGGAS